MASPDGSPRADGTGQGVALVVAAAFVTQTGAAVAVGLFDEVGALGAVFLRLALAAVLLCAVVRPPLRAVTRQNVGVVLGFGVALGGMNMLIYQAIARLPLGVAVTVELLGPLVLSVVLSRRLSGLLWAGLALAGVLLLSGVGPGTGIPDLAGVLFALAAAGMWACYILLSRQAGRSFPGIQGLALAMVVGGGARGTVRDRERRGGTASAARAARGRGGGAHVLGAAVRARTRGTAAASRGDLLDPREHGARGGRARGVADPRAGHGTGGDRGHGARDRGERGRRTVRAEAAVPSARGPRSARAVNPAAVEASVRPRPYPRVPWASHAQNWTPTGTAPCRT